MGVGSTNVPFEVCALLTSFNRCESTIESLAHLQDAASHAGVQLRAVLSDDGSTDGTADRVRERFAWVTVLRGDGSLYWNRGMHMAMQHAIDDGSADALLWLNDDTLLYTDALERLLATLRELQKRTGRSGIVVGATSDASTGLLSYSGCVATSRLRAFAFRKVFSESDLVRCDTMNGNVVLIPREVVLVLGNLDPTFEHSMGDLDYGLRATEANVPIAVAPRFAGTCSNNPIAGGFRDSSLPLRRRWQLFTDRKVLPPTSWRHMTRKHGGMLWPVHFVWPYASFLARGLLSKWRQAV